MKINQRVRCVVNLFREWAVYSLIRVKLGLNKKGNRKIFLDISSCYPNRYLYAFLKMFELQGYTVYIPQKRKLILKLNKGRKGEALFKKWLLSEGWIKLGQPKDPDAIILKAELSNDYFSAFFDHDFSDKHYHVPISEYPERYRMQDDFKFRNGDERKRSIFMAGNVDEKFYKQIQYSRFFNLLSRFIVFSYLQHNPRAFKITDMKALEAYFNGDTDGKVILLDTSTSFPIPGEKYKEVLSQFHFFLALPGIIVPNSHNLTEAMAAGCIPIIQDGYARYLRPALEDGVNAIFFKDLKSLTEKIEYLVEMGEGELSSLRQNVKFYYNSYLSPEAIVKTVIDLKFEKILIQGEWVSLQQYETEKSCE